MDIRHCQLVLGLLARWAARAAKRSREARQTDPLDEVTLDEAKS